jgi:hypothetical protein
VVLGDAVLELTPSRAAGPGRSASIVGQSRCSSQAQPQHERGEHEAEAAQEAECHNPDGRPPQLVEGSPMSRTASPSAINAATKM